MTDMYHEYNGVKFGYDGTTDPFPFADAMGWDALKFSGGSFGQNAGTDGAIATPLDTTARSWEIVVDVVGTSLSTFIARADELRAALWRPAGSTELAYDVVIDTDTRTRFARCVEYEIPNGRDGLVNFYVEAPITFESTDPLIYGPEQSETLEIDGTYAWSPEGWAPSWRWEAQITGPVTNPMISAPALGPSAVVRYVGSVASDETLVLRRGPRSILAKLVDTSDLGSVDTYTIGQNVQGSLDAGPVYSGRQPPGWFPITAGSASVAFDATAGSGDCLFTWREAKP